MSEKKSPKSKDKSPKGSKSSDASVSNDFREQMRKNLGSDIYIENLIDDLRIGAFADNKSMNISVPNGYEKPSEDGDPSIVPLETKINEKARVNKWAITDPDKDGDSWKEAVWSPIYNAKSRTVINVFLSGINADQHTLIRKAFHDLHTDELTNGHKKYPIFAQCNKLCPSHQCVIVRASSSGEFSEEDIPGEELFELIFRIADEDTVSYVKTDNPVIPNVTVNFVASGKDTSISRKVVKPIHDGTKEKKSVVSGGIKLTWKLDTRSDDKSKRANALKLVDGCMEIVKSAKNDGLKHIPFSKDQMRKMRDVDALHKKEIQENFGVTEYTKESKGYHSNVFEKRTIGVYLGSSNIEVEAQKRLATYVGSVRGDPSAVKMDEFDTWNNPYDALRAKYELVGEKKEQKFVKRKSELENKYDMMERLEYNRAVSNLPRDKIIMDNMKLTSLKTTEMNVAGAILLHPLTSNEYAIKISLQVLVSVCEFFRAAIPRVFNDTSSEAKKKDIVGIIASSLENPYLKGERAFKSPNSATAADTGVVSYISAMRTKYTDTYMDHVKNKMPENETGLKSMKGVNDIQSFIKLMDLNNDQYYTKWVAVP